MNGAPKQVENVASRALLSPFSVDHYQFSIFQSVAMISISIAVFGFSEAQMSTTQLLIRLPDELASRFKRSVSPRLRSKFIQRLLEEALPPEDGDDDPLYQAALAVEKEEVLAAEMAE